MEGEVEGVDTEKGEVEGVDMVKEALEVKEQAGPTLGQMEAEETVGQKVGLKVGHIPGQAMVEV